MSKSTSLELSIVPPEKVEPDTAPSSNVELVAPRPSAVELLIVILVATTSSIVPWNSVLDITPSVNVESSIVELVSTTLLPVPSLNSELVITTLFAVPSLNDELVIATLFAVPSLNCEVVITLLAAVPSLNVDEVRSIRCPAESASVPFWNVD